MFYNVKSMTEDKRWYAMRAMFNRALITHELLEKQSILSFVPMEMRDIIIKGKRTKQKLVPVILNLIFINATPSKIKELCYKYSYLQCIYGKLEGKNSPIIIPDKEMYEFIDVVNNHTNDIVYITPENFNISAGDRVKITYGALKDKEGILVKVKGKRSKQVVVAIDGLIAAMITTIDAEMIEKI